MSRRRYLRKSSLQECLAALLARCPEPLPGQIVATPGARGRVTAEPVYARRSVPHFHCSAMDGIVVRAEATFGASETSPRRLSPEQYAVVDTGDPIPGEFDAVIMAEHVQWLAEGVV